MLKWTDQTIVHNPKPVADKEGLLHHSTPFSTTRMSALHKVVRELTANYLTK